MKITRMAFDARNLSISAQPGLIIAVAQSKMSCCGRAVALYASVTGVALRQGHVTPAAPAGILFIGNLRQLDKFFRMAAGTLFFYNGG